MSNRLFRRFRTGILTCLVAFVPTLQAANVCLMEEAPFLAKSQPVYEDFLSVGWSLNVYEVGASIASSTVTGRNGLYALEVNFGGNWESLGLTRSVPLIPDGLRALVFRVRGIANNDLGQVWLTLTTIGGEWIASGPITDHMVTMPTGTYDPNTWYTVVLPMDELNPSGLYITGLSIMTGTLSRVYLDDMWLVTGMEFPLAGETAYTAPISSVYDHHRNPVLVAGTTSTYKRDNCADGTVTAYTGEEGKASFDGDPVPDSQNSCNESVDLEGYAKSSPPTIFSVNGQYTNDDKTFLYYDGHTGYDYPADNGTPVYAVADGVVTLSQDYSYGGTVVVSHRTGYESHTLHLNSRNVAVGDEVIAGKTKIGTVGSSHLHLTIKLYGEQVDPYGWFGTTPDSARPYAVSVPLWK